MNQSIILDPGINHHKIYLKSKGKLLYIHSKSRIEIARQEKPNNSIHTTK